MPTTLRFDPVEVGRAECASWAAYYRHEWFRFLTSALTMVREGFQLGPLRTLAAAWYVLRANQVWSPYPNNDPAAACRYMARFYRLVADVGRLQVDADQAAALEVAWWRVHRELQHDSAVTRTDLLTALIDLYAYVYDADEQAVRPAAEARVQAMDYSDQWVRNGCSLSDPLLASERRALVASYSAMRDALDRGGLPGVR
jgi:hypothetical protein